MTGKMTPGRRKRRPISLVEVKYSDFNTSTAQQYGSAGLGSDITAIAAGTGVSSRLGDQIDLVRIEGRTTFFCQTTNPGCVTRLFVFQWFPPTTPTLASFLANGVTGAPDYSSQYNYDNRHQFVMLLDKTLLMVGNAAASNNLVECDYSVPIRGQCNFASGATTGDRHVYVWFLGQNVAGANGQLVSSTNRFYFRDP